MRKVRRFTALVMVMVMSICMGTSAFAAEQSCFPEINRTDVVDSSVLVQDDSGTITLDLSNMDFTELSESDVVGVEPEVPPQDEKIYLLNETGLTSSDLDLSFGAPSTCRVTVILCAKFTDGTTADLSGSFGTFYGTVHVDGVARFIAKNATIYGGAQHFKITGITKTMAYNVQIYVS